jgi:hypothetical protein
MKTEINSHTGYIISDNAQLKTRGIWEDAGFMPPLIYMHLTEFLHLTYSGEERIPKSYLKGIVDLINAPGFMDTGLFVIKDRNKMYCFAESFGIDISSENDNLIAAGITEGIISDYILSDSAAPVAKEIISPKKTNI